MNKKNKAAKPDIIFRNWTSVTFIQPLTRGGDKWVMENVSFEPWQKYSGGIVCEPRMASALVQNAIRDGLEVKWKT